MILGVIAYAIAIEEAAFHPDEPLSMAARLALATGLALCSGWAMAVACDMPLVSPALFSALAALALETDDAGAHAGEEGGRPWDAVIPTTEGYPQPLHALYHRRCLPVMEALLAEQNLRIVNLYGSICVRYVGEPDLRRIDPHLHSFINVNTPEEWERALALLASL